jgi:hypothetical protein
LKPRVQSGKSFHLSRAIKKSRIVCIAANDYNKKHNERRFGKYENHKGFLTEYRPCIQSEVKLLLKIGEEELSDYELLNLRIDNNGRANMSKACPNCYTTLLGFSPRKVFYSDSDGECIQDERF